jgi:transcriptional regulator with XRE-family HTH domain
MRRAREDAGVEQRDAAARAGIHAVTLSKYENDKRPAPPEVRRKLAEFYGLPGNAFEAPPAMQEAGEEDGMPTRAIPLHVLTYWRGRVEEQVGRFQDVGQQITTATESLRSLLGMLERATDGVTEFLDGGVLPPLTKAEELARDYEDAAARAQAAKRTDGGTDDRRAAGGSG